MGREIRICKIKRYAENGSSGVNDKVVSEEPLNILVNGKPYSVLMRTPGNEEDLVLGFLYSERVIDSAKDVEVVHYCRKEKEKNTAVVVLKGGKGVKLKKRAFEVRSSCGICGEEIIDGLEKVLKKADSNTGFLYRNLTNLDEKIRKEQKIFKVTGGTHAAALFDGKGKLLFLREDIGRHNALDKIIGCALRNGINCRDKVVFLSGRTSYEMVLKAVRLGIPVLASISGTTSLAVDISKKFNLTLIGFLRGGKMNIYTHPWRIK